MRFAELTRELETQSRPSRIGGGTWHGSGSRRAVPRRRFRTSIGDPRKPDPLACLWATGPGHMQSKKNYPRAEEALKAGLAHDHDASNALSACPGSSRRRQERASGFFKAFAEVRAIKTEKNGRSIYRDAAAEGHHAEEPSNEKVVG